MERRRSGGSITLGRGSGAVRCGLAMLAVLGGLPLVSGGPARAEDPPAAESETRRAPPVIALPNIDAEKNRDTNYGVRVVLEPEDTAGTLDTLIAICASYSRSLGINLDADYQRRPSDHESIELYAYRAQHVEQAIQAHYEDSKFLEGKLRVFGELHQQRDGTDRYFGRGDDTPTDAESGFTAREYLADLRAGPNILPGISLLGTVRWRHFGLGPSLFEHLPDTRETYQDEPGVHGGAVAAAGVRAVAERRDHESIPEAGWFAEGYAERAWVTKTGQNTSLWRFGVEGRKLWPAGHDRWLVTAVRGRAELVYGQTVPFWELSSLGGDYSLRAYGDRRFSDRHSLLASVEERFRVARLTIRDQPIALQVAPFVEAGKVFDDPRQDVFSHGLVHAVHTSWGLGVRAVVDPYMVARVDLAWGSEGLAVTTGVGYTF